MAPHQPEEVVLARRLGSVEVVVLRPVQRPTGEFACACRMEVAGRQHEHVIYGEDSMQAVVLAIGFVASRLDALVPTTERAAWADILRLR